MSTATTEKRLDMQEIQKVNGLPEEKLNELPFGAIRLDKDGKILSFNKYEADLTGRDPNRVIGRNFFTEVAPCTNVKSFAGRYKEGVEKGDLLNVYDSSRFLRGTMYLVLRFEGGRVCTDLDIIGIRGTAGEGDIYSGE